MCCTVFFKQVIFTAFRMYVNTNDLCREGERQKDIATLEAQVYRLSELLSEQRAATRENVQRKQARTGEEREESDDEHVSDDESDDDEEDIPYNPKNLPLGWDGKVGCLHIVSNFPIFFFKLFTFSVSQFVRSPH